MEPGGVLAGQVHLRGGEADFAVEHITLELVARVEAEHDDGESEGAVAFHRHVVGGGFRLAEHERRSVPFSFALPWETPITELYGQSLGIVLGVRTELGVTGARDKGDLDPLAVRPPPVQEAILEAFGQLGFGFKSADLELGRIDGTGQQLPFYQEIELTPAPRYADRVNEVELTFLAGPAGLEVVLEADKRGGLSPRGTTRSPVSPWTTTTSSGSTGTPGSGSGSTVLSTAMPRTPPRVRTATTVTAMVMRTGTGRGPVWAPRSRPVRPDSPSAWSAAWSPPKSSTRWATSSRATTRTRQRTGVTRDNPPRRRRFVALAFPRACFPQAGARTHTVIFYTAVDFSALVLDHPGPGPARSRTKGCGMGVSLAKGGNVSLSKEAPGLTAVVVGLGWDVRTTTGADYDLDASALLLNEAGKVVSDRHFVFYNNLTSPDGSVEHTGDNLTGEGDGDDESIKVGLSAVPAEIQRIVFPSPSTTPRTAARASARSATPSSGS